MATIIKTVEANSHVLAEQRRLLDRKVCDQRKDSQAAIDKIFDDLDEYRAWCAKYGFKFDEKDLYQRRGPWNLMERERCQGLVIKDQWDIGAEIYENRQKRWRNRNNNNGRKRH